jgi:hypothetical protein
MESGIFASQGVCIVLSDITNYCYLYYVDEYHVMFGFLHDFKNLQLGKCGQSCPSNKHFIFISINLEIMLYLFNLTVKQKKERDYRIIGRLALLKSFVPEADSVVA